MVLVGYWPLNEENGDTAYDYSGNENHGSLEGSPTKGVAGIVGNTTYSFDGNNDYLKVEDWSPKSAPLSISVWFKPENLNETDEAQNLIGDSDNSGGSILRVDTRSRSHVSIYVRDDDDSWDELVVTSTSNLVEGEWYLFVMTYDNSELKGYLDGGKYTASLNQSGFTPGTDLLIGARSGTDDTDSDDPWEFFDGSISQIRIYNRALTASEVQYLYNVSKRGSFYSDIRNLK